MIVPVKCPICDGKQTVPAGFYEGSAASEPCRTCSGSGIVWAPETAAPRAPAPEWPRPAPYVPPWVVPEVGPYRWWEAPTCTPWTRQPYLTTGDGSLTPYTVTTTECPGYVTFHARTE